MKRLLSILSVVGGIGLIFLTVAVLLGSGQSAGGALAEAEASFRSSIAPGEVAHTITEHYRRQPPLGGPAPADITIGPDTWSEESYTRLASDGSVAEQVTFRPGSDGKPEKVRSVSDKQQSLYNADGTVLRQVTLPARLPFDLGASTIIEFVRRLFPDATTQEQGTDITVLEGEVSDPQANDSPIPQAQLAGLEPVKVVVRYEINRKNGVLVLFRETAIDAEGTQTVIIEDRVITVEVIPAPSFMPSGAR